MMPEFLAGRRPRATPSDAMLPGSFGEGVTLKKGDKVVRRDRDGVIEIRRITEEGVEELKNLLQVEV